MTPEEAIREAIRQFVASHRTWRQVREIRDAASVDDALPALAELWNCGASGPGTVAWRALGSHMLVSYPSDGRLVDVRLT